LLAEDASGTRLGAAWLRLWPGPEVGYGFVDADTPELTLSVVPGARGRGIGTALLRALLTEAARHHEAVSLSVSATNPARRLYAREGFTIVAEAGGSLTMVRRF
ncbi:MAG: GNAT family N-acetyltransferase, partial [Bacteroidota bacterium]